MLLLATNTKIGWTILVIWHNICYGVQHNTGHKVSINDLDNVKVATFHRQKALSKMDVNNSRVIMMQI